MPQICKMIKKYSSTLLKWVKCPKILYNKQNNRNRPKYPQNLNKPSVFWFSSGVFWSFSEISRVFCILFRIQWYFGHFNSFQGYCGCFVAFCSFYEVLGYFWHSWCILVIFVILRGSFQRFWCIYRFFYILVILIGKTISF